MFEELLRGVLLGLILSILVGPSMLMLISTSLERGLRQALVFASGIWISDLMFAILTYFGLSMVVDYIDSDQFRNTIGFIGASILFMIGVASLMKTSSKNQIADIKDMGGVDIFFLWLKGFAINTFNPFAIIFWIGVTGDAISRLGTDNSVSVMYASLILTIVGTDILKAAGAKRIGKFLDSKWMDYVKKGMGVAMIVFSLVLLYRTITL